MQLQIEPATRIRKFGSLARAFLRRNRFLEKVQTRPCKDFSQVVRFNRRIVALLLAKPDVYNGTQCTSIEYLVVDNSWQRKQLGTRLLMHYIRHWGIFMNIRLDCWSSDLEDFYKRFHFKPVAYAIETIHNEPELRHQMLFQRLMDRVLSNADNAAQHS